MNPESCKSFPEMKTNRGGANPQSLCDFLIRQAFGNKHDDLYLPPPEGAPLQGLWLACCRAIENDV